MIFSKRNPDLCTMHWIYYSYAGPFNLTKTSSSSDVNSISLSWDCVRSGCPPSEYLIKWSEIGMTEKQISTSTMAYTITGLNGCTNYFVTVEGEHRCGTSNFTNIIPTMEGGLYSLLSSLICTFYVL